MANTWMYGKGGGTWENEWTAVTSFLKTHAKSLDIPIVPTGDTQYAMQSDKQCALARLIDEHYGHGRHTMKQFSEDIGLRYATASTKVKGMYDWNRSEQKKICKVLGIPDEDKDKYFDRGVNPAGSTTTSIELRKRMRNHYGEHATEKMAKELGLKTDTVRFKLRGDVRWGEYKQQVCKILGIKPEEEAELFCDEME